MPSRRRAPRPRRPSARSSKSAHAGAARNDADDAHPDFWKHLPGAVPAWGGLTTASLDVQLAAKGGDDDAVKAFAPVPGWGGLPCRRCKRRLGSGAALALATENQQEAIAPTPRHN